jgi:hypothetical protein
MTTALRLTATFLCTVFCWLLPAASYRPFLLLSLSAHVYTLRRSAASSVVTLCSLSKRNQARLLQQHHEAYKRLMSHTLPHCGDADTQVWFAGGTALSCSGSASSMPCVHARMPVCCSLLSVQVWRVTVLQRETQSDGAVCIGHYSWLSAA